MTVIESRVSRASAEFATNSEANRGLATQLRELAAKVAAGGSASERAQQRGPRKMFVRDRIDRLLDPGSPVLEVRT